MVTVGSYRRLIALPAALTRHDGRGARIEDGALQVRFRARRQEAADVSEPDEPERVGACRRGGGQAAAARCRTGPRRAAASTPSAAASAATGGVGAAARLNEHVATGGADCTTARCAR